MKPRSAKAKGQNFAKSVVEEVIKTLGVHPMDAHVTPSGVNGMDIWLSKAGIQKFPFAVECKNSMTLNIWAAISQAVAHAMGTKLYPAVIFRRNYSDTYVCLHFADLLQILKKLQDAGESFEGFEKPLDPAGK